MNVAEIKKEIQSLSPEEQDQVCAHLVAMRQERDPEIARTLGRQVLNEDPNEWLTLDEVKRRL